MLIIAAGRADNISNLFIPNSTAFLERAGAIVYLHTTHLMLAALQANYSTLRWPDTDTHLAPMLTIDHLLTGI